MIEFRLIVISLSLLGAFSPDVHACLLSETLEKALFRFPHLRNNHAPLLKSRGERSLKGWREVLSDSERSVAIENAVKHDLAQSRTATLGKSSKRFDLSDGEVKTQAEKNIFEALELIKARVENPLKSSEEVYEFLREMNRTINQKLVSTYKDGKPIVAGSLRRFPRNDTNALVSPEELERQLESDLRKFSQEFFERLQKESDPSELASWSYLKLAQDLKPFGDGNGRTALMLAQYTYLARKFPPLTISQVGHAIDSAGMKHVGGVMEEAIIEWRKTKNSSLLKNVFDESSKETIRLALRRKAIPKQVIEKRLKEVGLSMDGGRVVGEGRSGTVARLTLKGQGEAIGLKWAKTYGDLANIRAEVEVTRFLQKRPRKMRKHFPQLVQSNSTGYWMAKEFIEGKTALEFLKEGQALTVFQKSELQQLFSVVQKIERKQQIYLDLLPKNIVWSEKRQTWVLIDLGPAYYPAPEIQGTFDQWWTAVWKVE